jgi:lipid A 3-O-deacylase
MKKFTNRCHLLRGASLIGWTSILATTSVNSQELLRVLAPASVFGQVGLGDQQTQAYLVGATWDWNRSYRFGPGTVSGYFEGAFGRWTTHDDGVRSTAWPTQISVTPVVRFRPTGSLRPWFAELGVGANYIVPVFESGRKRFGTEFNFGDHLAIGRDFGPHQRQELALRVEHFSNAGLAHPNPGENFVQIRYTYRLHE